MKINYYTLGGMDTASSRLRVHKIADELRFMSYEVETRLAWSGRKDADVVVFQKRFDLWKQSAELMRQGVPVVFDIDDPTDKLPECDVLTVGSRVLERYYCKERKVEYIPDCLDVEVQGKRLPFKVYHKSRIETVAWVGLACNAYNAEPVWRACQKLGLQLVMITDIHGKHEFPRWEGVQYIEWDRRTVDEILIRCDIVACPYIISGRWDEEWIQAKGENRILKAWALGLPVIGTPIPSYVDHGLRYCAETADEWAHCLRRLNDRKLRMEDVNLGRSVAMQRTSDQVARMWSHLFESLVP